MAPGPIYLRQQYRVTPTLTSVISGDTQLIGQDPRSLLVYSQCRSLLSSNGTGIANDTPSLILLSGIGVAEDIAHSSNSYVGESGRVVRFESF